MEGSGKGVPFFVRALLRGSFLGIQKDIGELGGWICPLTGNSERWRAKGMDMSVHREL